jgi:hypothetical protein
MTDPSAHETFLKVVKVAQSLLDEEPPEIVTPLLIIEKVAAVLAMHPKWRQAVDPDAVRDELIRRFSVWVGAQGRLLDGKDHLEWLNAKRKRDWRYWQRYREYLELSLPLAAIDAVDRATDNVLSALEDPLRPGRWDRRGLVVGHVQSGKTANYTGLICKAADAGYKIVIVLAGLHNNLRSQTQMRLDEGFLGFETNPLAKDMGPIGVGLIDRDAAIRPNFATNRANNGDFSSKIAKNLGITPEQRPWLFVVKKNKSVLEKLLHWVRTHAADATDKETGRPVVTNLPLLVIDDEADHASVDTGEQLFGDDGKPDLEHQPTTINRLVRRLLVSFTRSAYVGYTATPFANIFIHERGETAEEGPDLFPSAFIVNLGAPSNYVGPARVFGLSESQGRRPGLPLTRPVADHATADGMSGWMPHGHKNGHVPRLDGGALIPESLVRAVDSFVLATTVRALRGQGRDHASMLVHVTRFNSVQTRVRGALDEHVDDMRQRLRTRIRHGSLLDRLQALYADDFVPTTQTLIDAMGEAGGTALPHWSQVEAALADVVADIEIRTINGTAKDALDYAERKGVGLKTIAVGGDKLARGLTLEGLSTSYFLRASKMYDTLMQMGRWFGYRPGYLDLCRLVTTDELVEWFGHITDAAEELRDEFNIMEAAGATPREYGLKVQSHPVLMVTSKLKMRSARTLMLSFGGQLLETVSLFRTPQPLQTNLDVTARFLGSLPGRIPIPSRLRPGGMHRWSGHLWENVDAASVLTFFAGYRTHSEAHKVNSALIADYIEQLNRESELTRWTVGLIGAQDGRVCTLFPGLDVEMISRAPKGRFPDRYTIGRLMSPRDEAIVLDDKGWSAALDLTRQRWRPDPERSDEQTPPDAPSGPDVREVRGKGASGVAPRPDLGLLLMYVIDPAPDIEKGKAETGLDPGTPPLVAFGVSFPATDRSVKVRYEVNNVLWEQEYGGAE